MKLIKSLALDRMKYLHIFGYSISQGTELFNLVPFGSSNQTKQLYHS